MSNVIYKYEITLDAKLDLPHSACFLSAGTQGDKLVAWFLLDKDDDSIRTRTYKVYGTGWDIPEPPGEYLSTVQFASNGLVFHLFKED